MEKSAPLTAPYLWRLYIVGRKFLRCYAEAETKELYGIRSPVATNVLLSALDGHHHIAVDYRSYHVLVEGRPSTACTHFPFVIVAFRYLHV